MKRLLKSLLGFLFLAIAGAGAVLFWAHTGTLSATELATITVYPGMTAESPPDTFTVMTYNIGYLSGMTNNRPVDRTERLFSDNLAAAKRLMERVNPDIAAFQEIDFDSERSFGVNQLDALAIAGEYHAAAAVVNWDKHYVPFPSINPYYHFGRILSGQAVLSRFPVAAHERYTLERPPTPFYYDAFYLDRVAQIVRVDAGVPILVINVHLEAYDAETRNRQAAEVFTLYQRYKGDYPVLLLGDFNSIVPQERAFMSDSLRAASVQDHAAELFIKEPSLEESFLGFADANSASFEARYTFPSDVPETGIDHIFYTKDRIEPVDTYVVDGSDQPSDHRALVMRFVLKPDSAAIAALHR